MQIKMFHGEYRMFEGHKNEQISKVLTSEKKLGGNQGLSLLKNTVGGETHLQEAWGKKNLRHP